MQIIPDIVFINCTYKNESQKTFIITFKIKNEVGPNFALT